MAFIHGTPYYDFDQAWESSDMHANRAWAEHLAGGDWLDKNAFRPHFAWQDRVAPPDTWARWLGKSTYYQPPLYTYLLALGIKVAGGLDPIRWLQLFLGALNVVLIGALGGRMISRGAGLVAALLAAAYAPFILYDAEVLRRTLIIFLHLVSLAALWHAARKRTRAGWVLAGVALGVTYLGDSAIITFLPCAILWALLAPADLTKEADDEHPAPRLRADWRPAAWVAAGILAALAPLAVRNVAVGAPIFAVTTRAPLAFIMGNAPDAVPVGAAIPDSTVPILQASQYGVLSTILDTLKEYHGHLGGLLALQWKKLQGLFDSYEVPDNPSFYYAALKSPVLAWGLRFSCISGLGLVGLLLSVRRLRRFSLLHLYLVSTLGLFLLAQVVSRYRQPLVIPLVLFAGLACESAWRALRSRKVLVASGIIGASVGVSFALPTSPPPGYRYYRQAEFLVAAGLLENRGDINAAGSELKEAIALARRENAREDTVINLGLELGSLYERHQRYPEALSAFRDVLDDDPHNAEALATAGAINQDTGQYMQALSMLTLAAKMDPDNAEVQARLGYLYWSVFKDGGKALPHLRRALDLAPNAPIAPKLSKLANKISAATGLSP